MPFKGTNIEAWNKARKKSKNPKERSKIYYCEKNKIIKNTTLPKFVFPFNNIILVKKRFIQANKKEKLKYVNEKVLMDDIRDYKNSNIISEVLNSITISIMKNTLKNITDIQSNFLKYIFSCVIFETLNKIFEKPENIIDSVNMFIKIFKVVYKIVLYFDKKTNKYRVERIITINNSHEYFFFIKEHPKIRCLEKRIEIIDYLGKEVYVKVTNKINSTYLDNPYINYHVNYGYLPNITTINEKKQYAYILGVDEPLDDFIGIVKALIIRENSNEEIIVVCEEEYSLSQNEVEQKTDFQEQHYKHEIII